MYYVIQDWMHKELGLKGMRITLYAIIYGFSQNEKAGGFSGSLNYIADATGYEKTVICRELKNLTDEGLLLKTEILVNGVKMCKYIAVRNVNGIDKKSTTIDKKSTGVLINCQGGVDKMSTTIDKKSTTVDKMSTNNILYTSDNINNNLKEKKEREEDLNIDHAIPKSETENQTTSNSLSHSKDELKQKLDHAKIAILESINGLTVGTYLDFNSLFEHQTPDKRIKLQAQRAKLGELIKSNTQKDFDRAYEEAYNDAKKEKQTHFRRKTYFDRLMILLSEGIPETKQERILREQQADDLRSEQQRIERENLAINLQKQDNIFENLANKLNITLDEVLSFEAQMYRPSNFRNVDVDFEYDNTLSEIDNLEHFISLILVTKDNQIEPKENIISDVARNSEIDNPIEIEKHTSNKEMLEDLVNSMSF